MGVGSGTGREEQRERDTLRGTERKGQVDRDRKRGTGTEIEGQGERGGRLIRQETNR